MYSLISFVFLLFFLSWDQAFPGWVSSMRLSSGRDDLHERCFANLRQAAQPDAGATANSESLHYPDRWGSGRHRRRCRTQDAAEVHPEKGHRSEDTTLPQTRAASEDDSASGTSPGKNVLLSSTESRWRSWWTVQRCQADLNAKTLRERRSEMSTQKVNTFRY